MSAVTVDQNIPKYIGDIGEWGVKASEKIPAGVLVARNATPAAVNASDAAALVFAGVSCGMADNSSGLVNAINVRVHRRGIYEYPSNGTVAVTDIGKPLYVYDNHTLSIAATTHSLIAGRLVKIPSSGYVWVEIDAAVDGAAATS